jgi:hypothetical protein
MELTQHHQKAEKENNDMTDTNIILWLLLAFLVPL